MKNENILCIKRSELEERLDIKKQTIFLNKDEFENIFRSFKYYFIPRNEAETNSDFKQIIPYCVIINNKKEILIYERKGSENRLHGLMSLGIGGHLNDKDRGNSLIEIVNNGAKREIEEELPGISDYTLDIKGCINEDETNVGQVHFGIVFVVNVQLENIKKFDEELHKPLWININEISSYEFEKWSLLSLPLIMSLCY